MVLQHVLGTGWAAWAWLGPARGDEELLYIFLCLAGVHWYAMGCFMTGEAPQLSQRVKRRLPQSFLGRTFFTWFNPGPGTGYAEGKGQPGFLPAGPWMIRGSDLAKGLRDCQAGGLRR